MRILGIETSSLRGSVALVEGDRAVAAASHDRENAHDASILPLIEQVLASAGWTAGQLDRIAVGIGPGSFTGLRVGIALAQGISEGLQIPLVGVSSLQAMARAVSDAERSIRVPVLDARRGELFVCAYSADGSELLPEQVAPSARAVEQLVSALPGALLILGSAWDPLASKLPHHRSEDTDLPHARWVARAGLGLAADQPVRPLYLRPPVAIAPRLEPNPLSAEAGAATLSEGVAALRADGAERQR